jgi:hypothetical protein
VACRPGVASSVKLVHGRTLGGRAAGRLCCGSCQQRPSQQVGCADNSHTQTPDSLAQAPHLRPAPGSATSESIRGQAAHVACARAQRFWAKLHATQPRPEDAGKQTLPLRRLMVV